jgi:hypothetical protein
MLEEIQQPRQSLRAITFPNFISQVQAFVSFAQKNNHSPIQKK